MSLLPFLGRRRSRIYYRKEPRYGGRAKRLFLPAIFKARTFGAGLFLFFVSGGVVFGLFFSSQFRVETISVRGTEVLNPDIITQIVREYMQEDFFGGVPRDSYFLFPQEEISRGLHDRFPRIASLTVTRTFPHAIDIEIQERKIVGMWCQKPQGACAFFNETGTIFEEAPLHTKGTLFFLVEDFRKGARAKLGEQVLDEELYAFLDNLRGSLENAGLFASIFQVKENGEIHAQFRGWAAYFSARYNPSYQAQVLSRVLEEEVGEKEPFLDYVDLRIKNRVFYKYRD